MNQTLMQGLKEKDMQGVINSYALKPFYFPTLFPLKENMTLSWKALEATVGLKIAADIVSRGSTIPRKVREAISKIGGTIPKVAIAREMDENELTDYDIALAMSGGDPNLKTIVEFWANDMSFCWTGVASRVEWMALSQISTGKISVSQEDNQGVVTEFDVDYQIPTKQKMGVAKKWSATDAKPISDLVKIRKGLKGTSINPKIAFMNQNTFSTFVENEEVIKKSASFAQNALSISQTPDLAMVNAALARTPFLEGIQIAVIDQDITIEINGERKTGNPFADDVVLLSESTVLGNTYWKRPIDMGLVGSAALKVMNGPIMIKKFSTEEPVAEVTQGIANIFPAWNGANRSILVDTENTTFTK
ncbi:phage capsid protein [Elizabethkingia miricola]|nr:phage capsid protein [Elizabethkingia miricola]